MHLPHHQLRLLQILQNSLYSWQPHVLQSRKFFKTRLANKSQTSKNKIVENYRYIVTVIADCWWHNIKSFSNIP